jgi:hypothetical protein
MNSDELMVYGIPVPQHLAGLCRMLAVGKRYSDNGMGPLTHANCTLLVSLGLAQVSTRPYGGFEASPHLLRAKAFSDAVRFTFDEAAEAWGKPIAKKDCAKALAHRREELRRTYKPGGIPSKITVFKQYEVLTGSEPEDPEEFSSPGLTAWYLEVFNQGGQFK